MYVQGGGSVSYSCVVMRLIENNMTFIVYNIMVIGQCRYTDKIITKFRNALFSNHKQYLKYRYSQSNSVEYVKMQITQLRKYFTHIF